MSGHEKAAGMLDTSGAAQETNQHADSSHFRQHEATTIAQLAMKGQVVTRGSNNDFFVGKWGLIRHCPSYADLVAFALMVGVNHG
jgi:hypothetical protein